MSALCVSMGGLFHSLCSTFSVQMRPRDIKGPSTYKDSSMSFSTQARLLQRDEDGTGRLADSRAYPPHPSLVERIDRSTRNGHMLEKRGRKEKEKQKLREQEQIAEEARRKKAEGWEAAHQQSTQAQMERERYQRTTLGPLKVRPLHCSATKLSRSLTPLPDVSVCIRAFRS